LVLRVQLTTGLRVGDAVALKTDDVRKGRFSVQEQKTGKRRRVTIPADLQTKILKQAGDIYAFPHRLTGKKARTTSAVYKDLRRAAGIVLKNGPHIATHTARKSWAVSYYRKSGRDMQKVKKLLNHNDVAVTMLYALADQIGKEGRA
jgi:integrase